MKGNFHVQFRSSRRRSDPLPDCNQQRVLFSVQAPPPPRSTQFPSPKLLLGHAPISFAQGKTVGMSGGHSESLPAGNIHEVQNSIVLYRTLLSLHSTTLWAFDSVKHPQCCAF